MPSSDPSSDFLRRVFHRLKFRLHGFRSGLGQPVSVEALDREYAPGAWNHFFSAYEQARHEVLLDLIRAVHPRPRLLDLGCGSGRLASMLDPAAISDYLGADISEEGLRLARNLKLPEPLNRFERLNFETWTPEVAAFDVITFNECLGYAADPLRTARRFADVLPPDGALIVSHFQSTNHAEFWRRLAQSFAFIFERTATNAKGQIWDLRVLKLRH